MWVVHPLFRSAEVLAPKCSSEVSVIGSSTAGITSCSGSVNGLSKSSLVVVISVGLVLVMFFVST
jgi:hypothetical protein